MMMNNKKYISYFLFPFFFITLLFGNNKKICGLSEEKILKIVYIYNYAKKWKSKYNDMTFNSAISTIFLLESKVGEEWLGDIDKSSKIRMIKNLVEGSFGPGQIKLSTALIMIKTYPELFEKYGYLYHKDIYSFQKYNKYFKKLVYYFKILNSETWKKRWKNNKKLKVKKWAETEFKYWYKKYIKYKEKEAKDLRIIDMLKNDLDFSLDIAVHYLIYNYEKAIQKGLSHPYYRAISAYNGGWNNIKYLNRFFIYKKYIDCLKRKHILNY